MIVSGRKISPCDQVKISSGEANFSLIASKSVVLIGVDSFTLHTKKTLTKLRFLEPPSAQDESNSDEYDNKVLDLKEGDDEINLKGYIEDYYFKGVADSGTNTTITDTSESWAVNHRQALRKLIRHALGNPVTLTCLHKFAQPEKNAKTKAYLRHYLLRYAKNTALVQEVFLFLFGRRNICYID